MKKRTISARQLKIVLRVLFLASVYLILYKTIFNRPFDDNHPIKLELFWEIKQWIAGNGFGKDIINNVLLFVPFGITLGLIWGRWYVILVGFSFSLLVELSQLIFRIGWFELDDILNNTIGTALGFAVSMLVIKNFGMKEFMKNTKKEINPLSDKSGGVFDEKVRISKGERKTMEQNNRVGHPIASKVFLIVYDAIAVNLAYFLTFLLRFCVQFQIRDYATFALPIMWKFAPIFAVASVAIFYAFRMYDIRWQYCGLHDLLRIVIACVCTGVVYAIGTLLLFGEIPNSIYFVAPIVEMGLIGMSRVAYKLYLEEKNQQINRRTASNRSMIIGADSIGRFAIKQFEESKKYRTVVMLDPDNQGSVQYINGLPVVNGLGKMEWALNHYKVGYVVIADSTLNDADRKEIKRVCEEHGIEQEDFIEYLQNNNDTPTPVTLKEDGSRVIPFSPPDISEKEISEVRKALLSGWITTGPRTKELEKRLAEFCHTSKVVCLNSATAAEELNFRVCGIGEGDEVIVPAYTYTASASAAIHCGAKVIFVDSQVDNCEMDYEKVAEAITEKTKAIVAVDLGGIVADYDKLFEIVEKKRSLFKAKAGDDLGARIQQAVGRVLVFADCAHALGASRNGVMAGAIADFTDFSFHAVKNFTTAEGGASTWRDIPGIDNDEMYHMYQLLSLHGQSKDALAKTKVGAWEYDIVGPWYKCNMTDIMAAIGLRQLDRYPGILKRRKEIIAKYDAVCDELGVKHLIHYTDNSISSGHLYLTRIPGITDEQRREIITKLAERGVSTNVHYKPLPMMTAYKNLGWDIKDFPNAYAYYENLVTLPLHTKLSDEDVEYVVKNFRDVVKEYMGD